MTNTKAEAKQIIARIDQFAYEQYQKDAARPYKYKITGEEQIALDYHFINSMGYGPEGGIFILYLHTPYGRVQLEHG